MIIKKLFRCILNGLKHVWYFIRNVIFENHDRCYNDMKYWGFAAMHSCPGTVGGTKSTQHLSKMCVDCPYLYSNKMMEK